MIKYLLFKPLEPEELPTLKELTTSGKAPGGPCRSAVGAKMKGRRALETLRLGLGLQRGSLGGDRQLEGEPCLGLEDGFGSPGL